MTASVARPACRRAVSGRRRPSTQAVGDGTARPARAPPSPTSRHAARVAAARARARPPASTTRVLAQVRALLVRRRARRRAARSPQSLRDAARDRDAGPRGGRHRGLPARATWSSPGTQLRDVPREAWTRSRGRRVRALRARRRARARRSRRSARWSPTTRPRCRSKRVVRHARSGLRLRRRRARARRVRRSSTATSREDASPVARRRGAPRLDAAMGRRRRRLADRARARRRAPHVRDHGLRAPVGRAERRPTSATTSRASPRSGTSSATRASGSTAATTSSPCSSGCASARGPSCGASDVDADLEVITVHRDASMYEAIPEDTWVALLRLVHARALPDAPRLPAAPQPAADLRLVPLQQARPAHGRGDRVPAALRAGRLPRLDDRLPAALDRRAGVLLRLPDDDDRHRVPGPRRRRAVARRAGRLRRHRGRGRARGTPSRYQHSDEAVRRRSFVANVDAALELLETYRCEHRAVVTSRLHCYLPVRSIGVRRRLPPQEPLGHPLRRADRHRRRRRSTPSATASTASSSRSSRAILAGRAGGRGLRAVARDHRRRRRRRRGAPAREAAPPPPVPPTSRRRSRPARRGRPSPRRRPRPASAVHCAVVLPQGRRRRALSVLIASLLEHASRPLHVWVLGAARAPARSSSGSAERFPQVTLSWVPVRGLGADLLTPTGEPPEPETVARLLLADLLPGVDRARRCSRCRRSPPPTSPSSPTSTSAATRSPRRPGPGTSDVSGFGVIHSAALRLGRPHRGRRRRCAAPLTPATAFDFDAFTHDVLVLDLARLRARAASASAALAARRRSTASTTLEVAALPRRARPRRACRRAGRSVPTRTPRARARACSTGPTRVKPSQPELTPERERWRA